MSDAPRLHTSAMEGSGSYNRHAAIPASGGALALPLLENAARQIPLEPSDRPIVFADYGSSQGRNSLAPVRAAVAVLRTRTDKRRPIVVCHTDLPANDFSVLFDVVETDPESYLREDANVFPCAIGRSFYQSVFPPEYVDLGWSSYAAVWLSQIPTSIPGHFFIPCCTGAVRAAFDRQAATDWETFLSCRAAELRPGGRLVVALPSLAEDGSIAFAPIMDDANALVADEVAAGSITAHERERMILASCPRRERDLLAPFATTGQFHGLRVEHCSTSAAADMAWTDYERDGDPHALAAKRASFFRAVFVPSLLSALAPSRSAQDRQAVADRLEAGLRRRLLGRLARIDHLVGVISVAKQGDR
ncbi:MAG: hypothetical protein JOY94_03825 [Methylobacteriaceae bacterium]|nr:hypothetical protein [Methylobacteriaceae bacterium]